MSFLTSEFYGNTVRTWLIAIGVAVAVYAGLRVLRWLVTRRFGTVAERSANRIDDIIAATGQATRGYVLAFAGLYAGLRSVVLPPAVNRWVHILAVLVVTLQLAFWGGVIIHSTIRHQLKQAHESDPSSATTITVLGLLARLVLYALLLLMALANMGIEIAPLIAGLGIGGIAVALAVQNVLGDLFASLSIVLDKPFVIGDFISVDTFSGTIEYIGLKTTRLRSLSGEQLVFANSDLLSARIRNFKRMSERRIVVRLGVTYQATYDQVAAIPGMIREIIEAQEQTRFDRAHFAVFGDSALQFECVYYMIVSDYNTYMDTQQEINLALLRRFEQEGIEFAYPTQTLFLERVKKPGQTSATA